ncbi:O-antigen ligase family protein [Pontibacter ruber]|uniref:O-antigen ligase family protein n=1 Tax=Pontibacter ruber TaxID=1343895 RepID=A0ABW5D046_9BACT|nr:O-antigen ligase family protein [Pontibacter ruber]
MKLFFLLTEVLIYVAAYFILSKKKDLGIIYIPVLVFAHTVITPVLPIACFYAVVTIIVFVIINRNYALFSHNAFAVVLFLYYIILIPDSIHTLKLGLIFPVLLFFISLPLINNIYRQYSYKTIFKELTNASLLILLVFIANTIFATLFKFSPYSMYGISNGIFYGNLIFTSFNVVAIALFVVLLRILQKSNIAMIAIYIIAIAFILLTLRRSVMMASIIGIPFAVISTLTPKTAKKVIFFLSFTAVVGATLYYQSDFASVFKERYELRNLDNRELEEEKRFFEYEMLYKDMFVLKAYSPWLGFGLFNSAGNYGQGVFYERTLHGDLPSIAHSSGLIGVGLYLLMILTAFFIALKACRTRADTMTVFYCFIVFTIYTITGRYTQADSMLLLFLVCNLSLTKKEKETEEVELEEEITVGY